jgi:sodium-dependent dicarboxylate transporter 2/3/5
MPENNKKNIPTKIVAFSIIVIVAILGISRFFSATMGMPVPAEVALVILMIAGVLWITESVPLFVTSFIILALQMIWLSPIMVDLMDGFSSLTSLRGLFISQFFNDIILLFLGGFVLSAGFHKYKIDEIIAKWILQKTGSSSAKMLIGIMSVTAFLSMWMSNTATTAMMLTLCIPIIQSFSPDDPYRKALLLAVPFSANLGGMGTPIGTPPNAVALRYLQEAGIDITFDRWILIAIPAVLILLFFAFILLYKMYPPRRKTLSKHTEAEDIVDEGVKLSGRGWFVVGVAVLTALLWLTGGLHGFSAGTAALLPIIALFATRVLLVKDLRGLSWEVLFLIGGGFALGKSIDLSGLAEWLVGSISAGDDPYLIMLLFGFIAVLMATIMSRTATANLMIPIIMQIPFTGTSALIPVVIGATFAASSTMPLPVSTPPNAMAFSTGELRIKDMLIPGSIITLVGGMVIFTILYLWWDFVGLF